MWQKLFISTRKKKLTLRGLDNQDGQIAIFIALIFQIMFIFFAMLINVGLIVHDKINLQNSVDLAAYYGAERQAELLNKIAHINYQIRQEYKLLAFRQRILGAYTLSHADYMPPIPLPDDGQLDTMMPAVCVDHAGWTEILQADPTHATDNCKEINQAKPSVPTYHVITGWLGIHAALAAYYQKVGDTAIKECTNSGPLNWLTASLWFLEYKQSVQKRSESLREVADNLSRPGRQFVDIHNLPVLVGAQKTFLKNLTQANQVSVASKSADAVDNPSDFVIINSLSSDVQGLCGTMVGDDPYWLHENQISPQMIYLNATPNGTACNTSAQILSVPPPPPILSAAFSASPDLQRFQPFLPALVQNNAGEPGPNHTAPYSSLGFEKNPWCLAYVGVKASTRPRKPFAPFGKPISLVARAFASPFGGRIGPWYASAWAAGATASAGSSTDNLAVARNDDNPPAVQLVPPLQRGDLIHSPIPNYSRYPGDQLGLASKLVKYLFGNEILFKNLPAMKLIEKTFPLNSYDHLMDPNNTDSLAQSSSIVPPNSSVLRGVEIAAVAPDLFDLTYYSIDADYYSMYFDPATKALGDVGSGPITPGFGVHQQMVTSSKVLFPAPMNVNWLTPNLDYLLTGWIQGRTGDYTASPAQFARCSVHPQYDQGWPPTPGFCVVGGRTGYSVRIMARKYLQQTSPPLELGGQDMFGKILNPLPSVPSGW